MHGFHFLLRTVGVGYIRDTQCGFKVCSFLLVQILALICQTALHSGFSNGTLRVPPHSWLDIRRRTPTAGSDAEYPRRGGTDRMARDRGEQDELAPRFH